MYCSACGKSLPGNLNYCNNCGALNEKSPLIIGNSSYKIMGVAAAFVGMVGLVAFVGVLIVLLNSRLDTAAVIIILMAYLAAVFLMFAILIGHVWKNSGDIRIKSKDRADEYRGPDGFRGINTAQLDEYREPVMSVTDRTTKILENVPVERN